MVQWLTSEEMKEQRTIEIGYNPDTLKYFKFVDYNFGDALLISGMTGYGKSILAGNMAVEYAQHRRLLIFDYRGDYRNLKYVNFHNKNNRFKNIPDLVYLHRFGFKLQDFANPFDWEMLGMTPNGASICASKAKMFLYHRNDFSEFRKLIEGVETYSKKSANAEAWLATKQSILSKLNNIKYCFVDNRAVDITDMPSGLIKYNGTPFYVSDWKKFIKKHKHICLNMNSEFSASKAQLFAGKILNDIEPIMDELNPVILIEEAHKLCPAVFDDTNVLYSSFKILHFLKELHKKGVKLILITQYPHQLPDEALDEIKRFFFGRLQNIRGVSKLDEMFKLSSALEYNYIDDYREFWHFSPLYNERSIFVPYDSYTYYDKRR